MDHYTALVLSDVGRRSEDSEEESSVINDCNIIQQSRSQEEEECEGLSTASYPPPLQSGPGVLMLFRTSEFLHQYYSNFIRFPQYFTLL